MALVPVRVYPTTTLPCFAIIISVNRKYEDRRTLTQQTQGIMDSIFQWDEAPDGPANTLTWIYDLM
jgi:hypothetical protein